MPYLVGLAPASPSDARLELRASHRTFNKNAHRPAVYRCFWRAAPKPRDHGDIGPSSPASTHPPPFPRTSRHPVLAPTSRQAANHPQWKSFDFFDATPVSLADDETRNIFESNETSCVTSGSGNLFLGSYDGFVRIVSSGWKVVQSFRAHDAGAVTHMRQVEGTSLLVTVAVRAHFYPGDIAHCGDMAEGWVC